MRSGRVITLRRWRRRRRSRGIGVAAPTNRTRDAQHRIAAIEGTPVSNGSDELRRLSNRPGNAASVHRVLGGLIKARRRGAAEHGSPPHSGAPADNTRYWSRQRSSGLVPHAAAMTEAPKVFGDLKPTMFARG